MFQFAQHKLPFQDWNNKPMFFESTHPADYSQNTQCILLSI